ncbi:unnamed protein product [Brugia pahangi]|uniref:Transmembrane protein n=1 Tax=Brugia pahangi TaxID=6280 RepID=A0A0N4TH32_BRUPA|nr:unnamed protein product [Brugia pahangi]
MIDPIGTIDTTTKNKQHGSTRMEKKGNEERYRTDRIRMQCEMNDRFLFIVNFGFLLFILHTAANSLFYKIYLNKR